MEKRSIGGATLQMSVGTGSQIQGYGVMLKIDECIITCYLRIVFDICGKYRREERKSRYSHQPDIRLLLYNPSPHAVHWGVVIR